MIFLVDVIIRFRGLGFAEEKTNFFVDFLGTGIVRFSTTELNGTIIKNTALKYITEKEMILVKVGSVRRQKTGRNAFTKPLRGNL